VVNWVAAIGHPSVWYARRRWESNESRSSFSRLKKVWFVFMLYRNKHGLGTVNEERGCGSQRVGNKALPKRSLPANEVQGREGKA